MSASTARARPAGAADDRPYLGMLEGIEFRPVFIMGDHRSGTTLLYQLLDATQAFNVVRVYHLSQYHELISNYLSHTEDAAKQRLSDYFAAAGLTDRLIDGVEVTPDLPEEYGFHLKSRGFRLQLAPENLPAFVELCRKVQLVSDPTRPLLLKNPWDYFLNFMYVKGVFPTAKFIFIHRHPLHVINSQLNAVRASVTTRSAYNDLIARWYRGLYRNPLKRAVVRLIFAAPVGPRIVARHVVRGIAYYAQHVAALPQGDHSALRYEDLCAASSEELRRIMAFLGVEDRAGAAYERLIQPRPLRLLPEVERLAVKVERRLRAYYAQYGYGTYTVRPTG